MIHIYARLLIVLSIVSFSIVTPAISAAISAKDAKMEGKKAQVAKISVIDMHRIVSQNPEAVKGGSDEWKDLFNSFLVEIKPDQEELMGLENEYKQKLTEFQSLQNSKVASPEALNKKAEEIRRLVEQSNFKGNQYQDKSQKALVKVQQAFMPKVDKAMMQVKNAQGWDFVIFKDALAIKMVDSEFEITDDVLKILNTQYAQERAQKAAQKK